MLKSNANDCFEALVKHTVASMVSVHSICPISLILSFARQVNKDHIFETENGRAS